MKPDPPRLTLIIGSSSPDGIQEGDNVTLVCQIQASPPTNRVSWLFEGLPLIQEEEVIFDNMSLVLLNVKRTRAGKYNCLSANIEGEGMSNDINLRVQCK